MIKDTADKISTRELKLGHSMILLAGILDRIVKDLGYN